MDKDSIVTVIGTLTIIKYHCTPSVIESIDDIISELVTKYNNYEILG